MRVVVDTNVLVAGLLSPFGPPGVIVRLVTAGRLSLCAYLEHRCTLAGGRTNPFDGDAQESIFEVSLGNLRAIDRLARAALQRVANTSHTTVSGGDVIAARKSLWP
ncbi:MAG: hypothetical protein OXP69_19540 [Spirochaetaceae bacterium]|nr:hypothetical protein [Spirochaetaceae bacterium]